MEPANDSFEILRNSLKEFSDKRSNDIDQFEANKSVERKLNISTLHILGIILLVATIVYFTVYKPNQEKLYSKLHVRIPFSSRIIQFFKYLLPRKYRESFEGDLLESVCDLRAKKTQEFFIYLYIAYQLIYTVIGMSLFKLSELYVPTEVTKRKINN